MPQQQAPTLTLPSGDAVPLLGQGTRGMAEHPGCRADEVAALRLGLELGPALHAVALRHRATPAQVALAWVLRSGLVCAVPKSATPARVRQNRAALELTLGPDDLAELDQAFPPPTEPRPSQTH